MSTFLDQYLPQINNWGTSKPQFRVPFMGQSPSMTPPVPTITPVAPGVTQGFTPSISPEKFSLWDTEMRASMPGMDALKNEGSMPDKAGGWLDYGNFGLDFAKVGLGVYGALEQAKMNKFMQGYYGDQMDMQRADFENAAKSTNTELAAREARRIDAMGGPTFGSDENKAQVDAYMSKWGVRESF